MRRSTNLLAAAALGLATLVLSATTANAARVIDVKISVDGEPTLLGYVGDDGYGSDEEVWRLIDQAELEPVGGAVIESDEGLENEATLTGSVILHVQYSATADVDRLRLVRDGPDSPWRIPADEVERIAGEIGLVHPSQLPVGSPIPQTHPADMTPQEAFDSWSFGIVGTLGLACGAAFLLLVVIVAVVIAMSTNSTKQPAK